MIQKNISSQKMRDPDPAVWSLAQKAELGELRETYQASKRKTPGLLTGEIILSLSIVYLLYLIITAFVSPHHPSLLWMIPGLILVTIGCRLILPQSSYARWHIYLWDAGFLYEKGTLRQVFRWDQIESVASNVISDSRSGFTHYLCKVRRHDGYEVKLNNVLLKNAELIDIVLKEFSRQVAKPELKIITPRSRTLTDLQIDRQGIRNQQESLSWQEIEELIIEDGSITTILKEE